MKISSKIPLWNYKKARKKKKTEEIVKYRQKRIDDDNVNYDCFWTILNFMKKKECWMLKNWRQMQENPSAR